MAGLPLTVACAFQPSKDYNVEYVEKLHGSVTAQLGEPHRFVCVSTVFPLPCERIPTEHGWHGWWIKMEMFRLAPPVLAFDLDTVIVGSLHDIAEKARTARFMMLRDFYNPRGLGSGMMSWSVPMDSVYERFAASAEAIMRNHRTGGDQKYLESLNLKPELWQDVLPGQVVSYKADVRKNGLLPDARVICFHGTPRPRDVKEFWH